MPSEPTSTPPASFSARRRWGIFFSVLISIVAAFALVIMANYLGARYYTRLNWSDQTKNELSPQTIGLLKSITNDVKVVIYYDTEDPLYSYISALLDEYRLRNPKISVRTVDYLRDSAAAVKLKEAYKDAPGLIGNKNFVLFDCNNHPKIIPSQIIAQYTLEAVPNEKEKEFRNKLVYFEGQTAFSGALLVVTSPKPLVAYFLQGHGEHPYEGTGLDGYQQFKAVLQVNNIQSTTLTNLLGTNTVPADCNLLIIAGPKTIPPTEAGKIKQYVDQGGRLLVMLDYKSTNINTGLEPMLAEWGVEVGRNQIKDLKNSQSGSGNDLVVGAFDGHHPVVNRLVGSQLEMVLPRSVGKLDPEKSGAAKKPGAEAPKVEELAFSEDSACVNGSPIPAGHRVPLMVAVEKGNAKGVFPERGTTRMIVTGDSDFLDNQVIVAADNRAFAGYAVNWLLDQTQLLQGVGPQPITEYKLMMSRSQVSSVRWFLLAALPGVILAFGGLVWLRRRH
ncbi:MAG: hypothetical protein JWR26_4104 [Pedosphaera sp.]|nr:hypothetical protein [Pedosphaera sp.]